MKIAVIGAGISGLSAAYLLSQKHEIDLYEREALPGGHARTVDVLASGKKLPVDTGFLVYNERTYPLLTKLFQKLALPTQKSDMSFSVFIPHRNLVYNGNGLSGFFFQKRNLFSPSHLAMLVDVFRFNAKATRDIQENRIDSSVSLEEYLSDFGMPFRERYLYPMGGSIWSSPIENMKQFPALAFLRFFHNHGLLTVNDQPVWRTVSGGSREYVYRMIAHISGSVFTNSPVERVHRDDTGVRIKCETKEERIYDQVIFATHPPETLKLLSDADEKEHSFLRAFSYRENLALLHKHPGKLHPNSKVRASWNYILDGSDSRKPPVLSYWINLLQNPDTNENIFVTLNDPELEKTGEIHDRKVFEHPVFDARAIENQKQISQFDGRRNTWFCGSWIRNGFHEDGLWSAQRIGEAFGCAL